ncbi:vWA domain-containing protein [Stieleria varia]|uniref:VWFA domain-containing protein n=1 Tax=Stieleria varia TaxID=2528005 RepID=A0A5C6AXZ7_9BACT|nr:BatA and WFA domain-containing protein [Stieleria varia]TWU04895.1 hypothetical protein Pla52n_29400 [Stieleria varia]
MSWISTLSPGQWALLGAVPLGIILLYFLKLRREPVEIPSTYLWARTVEDLHVNSLLQRLRRNLLLLLQLLAIALAALALLRPGIRGEQSGLGRTVFLLDTSASMMTTDVEDDDDRFAQAKRMIGERIDTMLDTDEAMLITFSDRAEVLQAFTSDRTRLREALDRATVTNRTTDIRGALQAADGLANPRRSSTSGDATDIQVADAMPAEMLIYSDGNFQDVNTFNMGNLKARYVPIGSETTGNLAITAFSADRNVESPGDAQAYATITNYSSTPDTCEAALYVNGEYRESQSVKLDEEGEAGVTFSLPNEESAATVELRLESDGNPLQDELTVDNFAYAGLRPLRTVSVLVLTSGNSPLEIGLTTESAQKVCVADFQPTGYLDTEEYKARVEAGIDDLIIYDRCQPKEMPPTNTFFIGSLPPEQWSYTSEPGRVILVDIDRTHPLMQYLELYSLLVFSGRALEGPPGTRELVGADSGTMLALAPRDGFQDLVLGFEIVSTDDDGGTLTNTNWYAERSWPVFLLNIMRYLAGAADATSAPSYLPGETVRLRLESQIAKVEISRGLASGEEMSVAPGGIVEFVDTDSPGAYRVMADDKLVELFSVNLFGQRESNVPTQPAFELGYDTLTGESGVERRVEYWRWILVAMLALLAIEWWLYNKRIA